MGVKCQRRCHILYLKAFLLYATSVCLTSQYREKEKGGIWKTDKVIYIKRERINNRHTPGRLL